MLTAYVLRGGACEVSAGLAGAPPERIGEAVWVDLLDPTPEEERAVQEALGVEVPTREEMQEIEASSRLYREGEALYLTASFLHGVERGELSSSPVTFVLSPRALVTVRYATPRAFDVFSNRARKQGEALLRTPDAVMLNLFEQVVDRLADILERSSAEMDRASRTTFRDARARSVKLDKRNESLREALILLGQVGEVTGRASETLLGLSRILAFLGAERAAAVRRENGPLLKAVSRDVRSLVEHAGTMNARAQFLLDAVLGLVSADQSDVIKTFTVASVALMPPTLVASVYGMNFRFMPELGWEMGYPFAVLVMVTSAVLPLLYFRRKGWL